MSLRPPSAPSTPRTSDRLGSPGSTPSASNPTRRKATNTALPTRASSSLAHHEDPLAMDNLKDAMRKNDPGKYNSPANDRVDSPSPIKPPGADELRRRMMKKPSLANLRGPRSSTPTSGRAVVHPRSHTPTNSFGSSSARFGTPGAFPTHRDRRGNELEVGDEVTLDVAGNPCEGVVRFLGAVDGKEGVWGGVELDLEWQGQGKNDGSVKGVQYFACPPLSGLFVPLLKLTSKTPLAQSISRSSISRPSSRNASNTILTSSRAANLFGISAQDIARQRVAAANLSNSTGTPKNRPPSPEKLALSVSTNERGVTTPRAAIRSRQSLGGAYLPPARTPRKSMGPATTRPTFGTPRSNPLSASISKRPLAAPPVSSNGLPDVPPIPSEFERRSITPHQFRPSSVVSNTPGRRVSSIHLPPSESVRSTTPSLRSFSRQSFASSQSQHSAFGMDNEDDIRKLQEELRDAMEREGEMKKLLEGSERVGRDMENKLGDQEAELKAFREEREKERSREAERIKGIDGEEGEKERERVRVRELEEALAEAERVQEAAMITAENLVREQETKLALRELELESIRAEFAESNESATETRDRLDKEVETLRAAGQSLCVVYEEQISKLDSERLEAIEFSDLLTNKLAEIESRSHPNRSSDSSAFDLESTSSPLSPRLSSSTNVADAINAESALAEVVHLRTKLETMEEQLEEARSQFENEMMENRKRRVKSTEVEAGLKKEIKALKEAVELHSRAAAKAQTQYDEMEEALVESQIALENERAEVERLRHDTPPPSTSSSSVSSASSAALTAANLALTEDLRLAQKQIVVLKAEGRALVGELEDANKVLGGNKGMIEELKQGLRNSTEELEKRRTSSGNFSTPSAAASQSAPSIKSNGTSRPKEVSEETQPESGCEMCGKEGHELESCPDFGGPSLDSTPIPAAVLATRSTVEDFCDDCEEYGHSLEECPLQTF